jgi:hypothetical protein
MLSTRILDSQQENGCCNGDKSVSRIIIVVRDNTPEGKRSPERSKKCCPTPVLPETGYQPNRKEEQI